ncbi:MAG: pirin family protein [Gammaproteobacteria bacterium]
MIEMLIEGRRRDLGGFGVSRILPHAQRRSVGPFVFFDHMGPADFAPGHGIDVRPHPHIHLATVTYLFEGEIIHRDSLGVVQPIEPGAVNWMTAGRGIVHSERSSGRWRAQGGRLHGIQSWVALPVAHEDDAPEFRHHPEATLPRAQVGEASIRLIAGEAFAMRSPVAVRSPMFYADLHAQGPAAFDLPDRYPERAVYVVEGTLQAGGDAIGAGQFALFAAGPIRVRCEGPVRAMLLGGEPLGERHLWWNFVSSTPERIERARDDWKHGRFPVIAGETDFIPLPDEP